MANEDESLLGEVLADLVADALPVPGVSSAWQRLVGNVRGEWRRNTSRALAAAEAASGLSREDFMEWLANEPRAVPLYMKVLWAAGTNGHDRTLASMGAVLGSAQRASELQNDDAFDDAEVALRALENLTARHFRVLAAIAGNSVRDEDNFTEFTPDFVADQLSMLIERAHQCLLNLAAAGLAAQMSVLGSMAYPITDLGRAVMEAANSVQDRH